MGEQSIGEALPSSRSYRMSEKTMPPREELPVPGACRPPTKYSTGDDITATDDDALLHLGAARMRAHAPGTQATARAARRPIRMCT